MYEYTLEKNVLSSEHKCMYMKFCPSKKGEYAKSFKFCAKIYEENR